MIEIIALVLASIGIARFTKGRGGSPVVMVTLAVVGFLVISFLGGAAASSDNARIGVALSAWGWIGAVALFARFVIGADRPSPGVSWICSNCHFTNDHHSNVCAACEQPWAPYQAPVETPRDPKPEAES